MIRMNLLRRSITRVSSLILVAAAVMSPPALAGPINTNVAFTPRKGGSLLRLQYIYSEADGQGPVKNVNRSTVKATFVYGLEPNLALFLTAPYVNRQVDRYQPRLGRIEEAHDGLGDLTLLAKYRFWQNDAAPGKTTRWAALGGLNFRSGDSDFSSDSYDPILGTVFTWQDDRHHFDADLIYQFNTGRGRFRHDDLRYDVAYSYRLTPARFDADHFYEVDVVAEINGRYRTDGSHEVFLSPGIQYVTRRWAWEASIQIPTIQELTDDEPETKFRFVVGVRYRW